MIEWPGLEGYEVGRVYIVEAPTYIQVSKKRTEALNLNVYRNLHHHYLDKQKKNFHAEVKTRLAELPHLEQIAIHYEIFAPRNNRLDTMNVGSITDKYFSDTLVEAKKILDDNYKHIVATSFSFGGIDRMNGHAKITIYELKKELPMRVLLDDNDIQIALENYVAEAGIAGATGVEITVQGSTIEAEVQFGESDEPETKPAPKKGRGGRPRGSKNKPKVEETADANDDTEADSTGNSDTGSDGVSEDPEKAEGSKGKANPFEEKGTQSSDSAGKTEEAEVSGDPEPEVKKEEKDETPGATATKAKKSSIFDM